jgi:hypothetical protein
MNKAIALLLSALVLLPSATRAQTYYATSVSGATTPSAAFFDENRADDLLTQVNNLTITNIVYNQSGATAVITAQGTIEVQCFSYPCYPQPVTYAIRIFPNTRLMVRTRAATVISTFIAGDHINVYGFLDRDNQTMDALIMRDLDKPVVRQYLQINNLQVQSRPGQFLPTSFTAIDMSNPCVGQPSGTPCPFMPTILRTLTVNLSARTSLLYVNRRLMPLYEIVEGDRINVYGLFDPATNVFDAIVVRDLSKPSATPPPIPQSGLTYAVSLDKQTYVPDEPIVISTRVYNGSSQTRTLSFNSGCQVSYTIAPVNFDSSRDMACTLSLTAVTVPAFGSYTWVQTHAPDRYRLSAGNYTLTSRVIGYDAATVNFTVSGSSGTGYNQPPSITSVSGPTIVSLNQVGTWMISAYDPEAGSLTYSVQWGDEVYLAPNSFAGNQVFTQTGTFTHVYAQPGVYTLVFTVTDQSGAAAQSRLTVSVSSSGTAPAMPQINLLSPSSGVAGTIVTVYGSGFTPTGNTVVFGQNYIQNISSSNGTVLSFNVPSYINPYCPPGNFCAAYVLPLSQGVYPVSVSTGYGQSNILNFTVQ